MAKSKPITIGTQTFNTRAAARESILAVRDRHPLLARIDGPDHEFLLALLSLHPRAAEKVGAGVKYFTVEKNFGGTHGFYVTRVDGTRDDFSIDNCLKG